MYYEKSFQFYQDYLEKNPNFYGYQLSLLEAYVIAGEMEMAAHYSDELDKQVFKDKSYEVLLDYLKLIIKIVDDELESYNEDYKKLRYRIENENVQLSSWSFDLLLDWKVLNQLDDFRKKRILNLTKLFH